MDMYKLKEKQTLRNDHLMQQMAVHKRNERERLSAMTSAPDSANLRTARRPIPELAPVIATRMSILSFGLFRTFRTKPTLDE